VYFSYQDPYDEYKTRLAKKLAKRAEAAATGVNAAAKRDTAAPTAGDSMNWFGTKVGADAGVGSGAGVGAGVGKYLAGAKRPLEAVVAPAGADGDKAKKKKLGFGDFAGW
jgi:peptidyl-prolyl cis-trans isomerase-like protein 2